MINIRTLAVCAILMSAAPFATNAAAAPTDPPEPRQHKHVPAPHDTVPAAGDRFVTNREGAPLVLPTDEDSFIFAVFGDRTGGPAVGVKVLQQAVNDVNLIEPDLVMTVGDMIQGYAESPTWLREMREYKAIMDQLACPWFPVAGNHDTYWRDDEGDEQRPENEHEGLYEMHFGPLWYAFEHRGCWFIVLYTDEGNPDTGEMTFRDPDAQRMSPEQFQWLDQTLTTAQDARHVFVFVHHPRWLGRNYGDDWDKVHDRLVDAGNVTAVFGGHIHRMRSDPKDGIEYVALATVGAHQSGWAPRAGFLHHYNLVTVRDDQVAMASIPVGEVMDVRAITGEVSSECERLAKTTPRIAGGAFVIGDKDINIVRATIVNPTSRPVDYTVSIGSSDSRWRLLGLSDHIHGRLEPNQTRTLDLAAIYPSETIDWAAGIPTVDVDYEYLGDGIRVPIPTVRATIPVDFVPGVDPSPKPQVLPMFDFDGTNAIRVESLVASVPQGPITVEAIVEPDHAVIQGGDYGVVSKTENAEYGVHIKDGKPQFWIHLRGEYVTLEGQALNAKEFVHIAGVFDGQQVRLYVGGELVAAQDSTGPRRTNTMPLYIGAEVDRSGNAEDFFVGRIHQVMITPRAKYAGDTIEFTVDEDATLWLDRDPMMPGPWVPNRAGVLPHPTRVGGR